MKRCKTCGEVKPLVEFYAAKGMRDGRRNDCKSCNLAAKKVRYAANPQRHIDRVRAWQVENSERYNAYQRERRQRPEIKQREREGHLRRKFGITNEDYESMLAAQGGRCAICRREPNPKISLHVDHDHETGTVRGLLCVRCNNGIALFDEDHEVLRDIAHYLDAHDPEVQEMGALIRERARLLVSGAR
jgi:hypothetical protein